MTEAVILLLREGQHLIAQEEHIIQLLQEVQDQALQEVQALEEVLLIPILDLHQEVVLNQALDLHQEVQQEALHLQEAPHQEVLQEAALEAREASNFYKS